MLALAALIALQAGQVNDSLAPIFAKMFPNPTGENAMEDYIQAGDQALQQFAFTYLAWQPPERRATDAQLEADRKEDPNIPPEDPKLAALRKRLNTLSMLGVYQEEAKVFRPQLDLVANGNGKAITFPPSITQLEVADGTIRTLQRCRAVARVGSQTAYSEFAEGRSDAATEDLARILAMSDQMERGDYLSFLSGVGNTAVVLAMINERRDQLSVDDANVLDAFVTDYFRRPPALRDALVLEARYAEALINSSMDAMMKEVDKGDASDLSGVEKQLMIGLKKLSPADRQAMYGRVAAIAVSNTVATLKDLDSPEDSWIDLYRSRTTEEDASDKASDQIPVTAEDLANALASMFDPNLSTGILVSLRSRVQMRLLRLHSRVIAFRWEMDRLPKSLEEMRLPTEETYDPLSKQPFAYELKNGVYRLFSRGVPETGEIELKYKRVVEQTKDIAPPR